MIPDFRHDGTLPPGQHEATWEEIGARFGGNDRRDRLLTGLGRALMELQRVGCVRAWIDGSFVTDKPEPGDYDGCWTHVGVVLADLDPVLLQFMHPRSAQKAKYLGEMFIAEAPADTLGHTFLEFFQQRDEEPKGIITITLRSAP